jgi:hypothetical protein
VEVALALRCLACLLNRLGGQYRRTLLWHSHEQPAAPLEFDGQWRGLDLNATILEAHVEHHTRRETSLASQATGDHDPSRRVNGSFHGSSFTTNCPMPMVPL